MYDDFDPGSGSRMASHEPGLWRSVGGVDDYLHSDMIGTLRITTIGSGPSAGTPGLPRVFTAFGEKITGPQDRNGYAGAWGYQTNDTTGGGTGTGGGGSVGIGFDFLHVGARYYDPGSGRFLQRDLIGIDGGINVYAYLWNAPTIGVDPSGRLPGAAGDGFSAGHEFYEGAKIFGEGAEASRNDWYRRHILSCHPGSSGNSRYHRNCRTCQRHKKAERRRNRRRRNRRNYPRFSWYQFWNWGLNNWAER